MPFIDRHGNALLGLPLVYRLGRDFQVAETFCWRDPRDSDRVLTIPAHDLTLPPGEGNSTDFASVPPFLWGLIASFGKQTLPAILHDELANRARLAPADERLELRRTADEDFRVALIDSGVHQLRARVMWAAVGMERYVRHAGRLAALLIAQLGIGVLAIVSSVALGIVAHPLWLLLGLAPAIAALVWGKNAKLVLAASYLGALYAPLVAAAFTGSRAEQLLAISVWAGTGTSGPLPKAEPTLRWPDRGTTPPPR
ncbi:ketol-acid reductoisomerase [marine actinobacterium PHSC20C1]|nr:ketol-acid reductoisomerase [marine actinobacterium PHSC20C1]